MPYIRFLPRQRPAVLDRGSVLVVTMVFATGIAISLGSFIAVSVNSAKLSQQSFYANSALNLAEAGLEQALNAMNSDQYSGWTVHATGASSRFKTTQNLSLGQGVTGQIKVLIFDILTSDRKAVAEGIVTPTSGPAIRKQVELRAGRRSFFATGLVSKDSMTFNGNGVMVNSWNSDPDNNPATAAIPYSDAVKASNGSVASTAVTISIGNADVWGFVATARDQPDVGNSGTIAAYPAPEGTKDLSRITTDFKHNFETIVKPTGVTLNVIIGTIGQSGQTLPMTLPQSGDVSTFDPVDGVAKYYYQLPGIDAGGNSSKVLTIAANVVLLPTAGSGATAIGVGGSASIKIGTGASLAIYTEGDIAIAGNGFVNGEPTADTTPNKLLTANQPKALQIYGTNTSLAGQSFSVSGNGVLSAVTYAPNASLTLNGGGSSGHVLGAFVAKTVSINGGNNFHYDESLKTFGGKNSFELTSWRELFGAERTTL